MSPQTRMLKELSGGIVALHIAHEDLWVFSLFPHCIQNKGDRSLSVSLPLVTPVDEKLAKLIGILFGSIQIHSHPHRGLAVIEIENPRVQSAVKPRPRKLPYKGRSHKVRQRQGRETPQRSEAASRSCCTLSACGPFRPAFIPAPGGRSPQTGAVRPHR